MKRSGGCLVVGLIVGLLAATGEGVALAQGACTRTYRGDLVLEGEDRLVITEGVLCVSGEIILRDNARLEVSNATIRLTGQSENVWGGLEWIFPHDRSQVVLRDVHLEVAGSQAAVTWIWIWMYGSSHTELHRVSTRGSASLGVYVGESSSAKVTECTMGTVFVADTGAAQVVSSSLDGVSLKFSTAASVALGSLRPAYYENWDLPRGTGAQPRLSLERTRVGSWSIEATALATVAIRDSDVMRMALYPGNSWSVLEGVRPGHYSSWELNRQAAGGSVGNVSLTNTHVGAWTININDRRRDLSLRDCSLVEFSAGGSVCLIRLERTATLALQIYDSHLTLECDALTLEHGVALHDGRLTIKGTVDFPDSASRVVWENSSIGREYEVQVRGRDGQPARGVPVRVEDPQGRIITYTSDQDGVARFTIWFSDTTYDKTWHLLVPQGDTTARVPITLLTSTPVEVTSW